VGDHRPISSNAGLAWLQKIRGVAAPLPEVEEKIDGFGHTTFRVKDKPFVFVGEREEGLSMSVKTDAFTQELLLQQDGYTKTPYIGQHGWVSLMEDGPIEWMHIEELIQESYMRVAPKRLLKQLQAESS
jgi:predicted DNA-binding protein (MmcQ/YjbR family)